MTALWTALVEGETKESLATMVCKARATAARQGETIKKLWMTAVLVSDNELAVAQDALETIQATLRHRQQPQDVTFHRGLHALRDAREVLAKLKDTP